MLGTPLLISGLPREIPSAARLFCIEINVTRRTFRLSCYRNATLQRPPLSAFQQNGDDLFRLHGRFGRFPDRGFDDRAIHQQVELLGERLDILDASRGDERA